MITQKTNKIKIIMLKLSVIFGIILFCGCSSIHPKLHAQTEGGVQGILAVGKLTIANAQSSDITIHYSKTYNGSYSWSQNLLKAKRRYVFTTKKRKDSTGAIKALPAYVKLPDNQVFTVEHQKRYIVNYSNGKYTLRIHRTR